MDVHTHGKSKEGRTGYSSFSDEDLDTTDATAVRLRELGKDASAYIGSVVGSTNGNVHF